MKKYLDKTHEEKIADDLTFLRDYYKEFGLEKLLKLVTDRHAFINTRSLKYRNKLTELGVDVTEVHGDDLAEVTV